MDEAEVDFVIDAVEFIAEHGEDFLPWYTFCIKQAGWKHINDNDDCPQLKLEDAFVEDDFCPQPLPVGVRKQLYNQYFEEARQWASQAPGQCCQHAVAELDESESVFFERFQL
jgi:hypothetical protein